MTKHSKDVEYYVGLPYRIEITPEEDGSGFNTAVPDLKGCMAFGETVGEALETLADVKRAWIEIAVERGWRIPEPASEEARDYSGRFNVRLARYLHRQLAELAREQSTSLNQLVVHLLAEGVGRLNEQPTMREEAAATGQQLPSADQPEAHHRVERVQIVDPGLGRSQFLGQSDLSSTYSH